MSTETKTSNTEKLNFDISIEATPAKVWQVLWDDTTYRQWTSVFAEGSYAIASPDWSTGSRVHFLTPKGEGMYSEVAENKPKEVMTFKHLGELKDFKEQPASAWSGATETYRLEEKDGTVKLTASMDATDEFKDYFTQTFPKAFNIVKELSEKPIEITIEATVNVPVEEAWELWTNPKDICKWNFAIDEWHCPSAENDLRVGGKFVYRMAAKDGSFGFDFSGIYTDVKANEVIAYTMEDGRKARVTFTGTGDAVKVVTVFEAEAENSIDLQRTGWQAILDNFKKYAEGNL